MNHPKHCLFHGSYDDTLTVLEPRAERNGFEDPIPNDRGQPRVYLADRSEYAWGYAVPPGAVVASMDPRDGPCYLVFVDRPSLEANGYIYSVDWDPDQPSPYTPTTCKGQPTGEYISFDDVDVSIRPPIIIERSLERLARERDVQIYCDLAPADCGTFLHEWRRACGSGPQGGYAYVLQCVQQKQLNHLNPEIPARPLWPQGAPSP
jgi:hypothetical protein